MTEHPDILAALDGAEVLSVDGAAVTGDAATLLGRMRAPATADTPETESRTEGGGDEAASEDAGPVEARAMGYSVEAMNTRHALVLVGSKAVVMDENPTAPIEEKHVFRTLEAFGSWYANKPTEIIGSDGKIKVLTWAARWMKDRNRRQYSGVCFFPNPDGAPAPAPP